MASLIASLALPCSASFVSVKTKAPSYGPCCVSPLYATTRYPLPTPSTYQSSWKVRPNILPSTTIEAVPRGPLLLSIVSLKLLVQLPEPSGFGTRKRMSFSNPPSARAVKVLVWHGYLSYLGL